MLNRYEKWLEKREKGSEKRSETCPKNVKPLSRRLKMSHWHFSKSFSPPKICAKQIFFFFSARLCRVATLKIRSGVSTPMKKTKFETLQEQGNLILHVSCCTVALPAMLMLQRYSCETSSSEASGQKRRSSIPSQLVWVGRHEHWTECVHLAPSPFL